MIKQTGNAISYPGSKNQAGVWTWIIHHLPAHAFYVEPFVGSGAVLRRKPPALQSIVCDTCPEVLAWWERLAWPGVAGLRQCGIRWLELHAANLGPDWLLYLDPPYPLSTRTKKRIYKQELSDGDHDRILAAIAGTPARVIISSYDSPAYSSALASWYRSEQLTNTRGGLRTEVIWCNFDPYAVARAHPSVLPGRDWRERERIKRKVGRWKANLAAMAPFEREAIAAELVELLRGEAIAADRDAGGAKWSLAGRMYPSRAAAAAAIAAGDVAAGPL